MFPDTDELYKAVLLSFDAARVDKRWAEIVARNGDPGPLLQLVYWAEIIKTGRLPKADWRGIRPTRDDELLVPLALARSARVRTVGDLVEAHLQAMRKKLAKAQAALGGKAPKLPETPGSV